MVSINTDMQSPMWGRLEDTLGRGVGTAETNTGNPILTTHGLTPSQKHQTLLLQLLNLQKDSSCIVVLHTFLLKCLNKVMPVLNLWVYRLIRTVKVSPSVPPTGQHHNRPPPCSCFPSHPNQAHKPLTMCVHVNRLTHLSVRSSLKDS